MHFFLSTINKRITIGYVKTSFIVKPLFKEYREKNTNIF